MAPPKRENSYIFLPHLAYRTWLVFFWGGARYFSSENPNDSVNPLVSAHHHPYYMVEKMTHVTLGIFYDFLNLSSHNLRVNTIMWPPKINISYIILYYGRVSTGVFNIRGMPWAFRGCVRRQCWVPAPSGNGNRTLWVWFKHREALKSHSWS
jgi:hypothetical protein